MTGIKHDKEKIRPRLVINSMARALKAVSAVGTFGANKYADDNWMEVDDGINRYTDAMYRHLMAEAEGELVILNLAWLTRLMHVGIVSQD